MSEEILINITPMESRVAVVENGVLQEVHVERTQRRGIVGNIYKGRVVRVLPGMQAAFVDIGLERAAFIHAAEISNREGSAVESISALVHEGQALVVQVTKDPIGTKGARLTTHLSIPSRYLVYMPRTSHVGISLRIEDEVERERLKKVVADCVAAEGIEGQGGFILRTAAEGAGEDEILADIRYLRRLWDQIAAQIQTVGAPSVIYEDLSLAIRTLRDLVNPRIEKIRIDSRENFQKITSFVEELMPEISDRLEHYPGERPIFDLYGVEDEIQKALERKVLLKSGGYLIVDPTEAMTTIDVNTGASSAIATSRKPSSRPTSRRPPRSPASCACATWAGSSSSTSSTWRTRSIAGRSCAPWRSNWSATTRRPTSSASPSWAWCR